MSRKEDSVLLTRVSITCTLLPVGVYQCHYQGPVWYRVHVPGTWYIPCTQAHCGEEVRNIDFFVCAGEIRPTNLWPSCGACMCGRRSLRVQEYYTWNCTECTSRPSVARIGTLDSPICRLHKHKLLPKPKFTSDYENMSNEKHYLEDYKSWELAVKRHGGDAAYQDAIENRQLKKGKKQEKEGLHYDASALEHYDDDSVNESKHSAPSTPPTMVVHNHHRSVVNNTNSSLIIKQKNYNKTVLPPPNHDTMQALMIDAGSQGSRIHVYEFQRRILYTPEELTEALNGFKLSIPTTNTRWTNRLNPGLDALAAFSDDDSLRKALIEYLGPLFDFAKTVLDGKKHSWHRYPIYLKATGGLRTLPTPDRVRLINAVRDLFQNKTFNPFNFDDPERARVISGEEEAMYGWAAVNFAIGTLVKDTEGKGIVLNPHRTWGMLEMGGASTQIAWYENQGDVMANLMKLQIGGARHWNIYAHSFLYFGVNGAWWRLNARLYMRGKNSTTINPCLPSGVSFDFESWIHYDKEERPLPRSDPRSTYYNVTMSNNKPDFEQCSLITRALLRKEANKDWVEFSHDGDCSFAGVYQPPLPTKNSAENEFILTSNYHDVWDFLQLPPRAKVIDIQDGARRICTMDLQTLTEYNAQLDMPVKDDDLYQFCFRATLTFEMLHAGYGFPLHYEILFHEAPLLSGFSIDDSWNLSCRLTGEPS